MLSFGLNVKKDNVNKRVLTNIVLAVCVCGLAAFTWLKPGRQLIDATRLTNLAPDSINRISIKRINTDSLELAKKEQQWQITSPLQALALPGKVERLLKISQIKALAEYPLDDTLRQNAGLLIAKTSISYNNTRLTLGGTEPVQSRRYVANSDTLFLVDDTFIHHLTAPIDAYIDTRLFTDNIQINELKTPELHIRRQQNNTWQTISSINPLTDLSADAVQILLDEWRFARAIRISIKETNLAPSVTIILDNGERISLALSKQANGVSLTPTNSSLNYHFSDDKYKKMTTVADQPDA